jgi:hypothetical protein
MADAGQRNTRRPRRKAVEQQRDRIAHVAHGLRTGAGQRVVAKPRTVGAPDEHMGVRAQSVDLASEQRRWRIAGGVQRELQRRRPGIQDQQAHGCAMTALWPVRCQWSCSTASAHDS